MQALEYLNSWDTMEKTSYLIIGKKNSSDTQQWSKLVTLLLEYY